MQLRHLLTLAAIATTALLVSSLADAGGGNGWVKVFNGKDMANFKYVLAIKKGEIAKGDDPLKAPTGTWKVEDGVIICTGKPNGYFYEDKVRKNYMVKYDWRYKRPDNLQDDEKFGGNSGYLAGITGEHKVWPKCVEIQGMNKEHGRVIPLGGFKGKFTFDAEALKKARKPVGEWNTTEIVIDNGKITSKVNGVQVATGEGDVLEGAWGLQSEGAEIHFRNIFIKEMK